MPGSKVDSSAPPPQSTVGRGKATHSRHSAKTIEDKDWGWANYSEATRNRMLKATLVQGGVEVGSVLTFGPLYGWTYCHCCNSYLKIADVGAWERHQKESKKHAAGLKAMASSKAPSQQTIVVSRGAMTSAEVSGKVRLLKTLMHGSLGEISYRTGERLNPFAAAELQVLSASVETAQSGLKDLAKVDASKLSGIDAARLSQVRSHHVRSLAF